MAMKQIEKRKERKGKKSEKKKTRKRTYAHETDRGDGDPINQTQIHDGLLGQQTQHVRPSSEKGEEREKENEKRRAR